jgi:hypothetical protein
MLAFPLRRRSYAEPRPAGNTQYRFPRYLLTLSRSKTALHSRRNRWPVGVSGQRCPKTFARTCSNLRLGFSNAVSMNWPTIASSSTVRGDLVAGRFCISRASLALDALELGDVVIHSRNNDTAGG